MRKFVTALQYTLKSAAFLWKRNKLYLLLILLGIGIEAIVPFPHIFLSKYSIDLLTQQVTIGKYILSLTAIIAIIINA